MFSPLVNEVIDNLFIGNAYVAQQKDILQKYVKFKIEDNSHIAFNQRGYSTISGSNDKAV